MPAGTSILFHNDTSNDSGSVPGSIPILGGIGSKGRKSTMETTLLSLSGIGRFKTFPKIPLLAWNLFPDNIERGDEMTDTYMDAKARRAAKELGWWQNAPDGGDALGTISGSSRLSTPQLIGFKPGRNSKSLASPGV